MNMRIATRGLVAVLLVAIAGCIDRCPPKLVFQFPVVDETGTPIGRDVGEAEITVSVGHPPRHITTKTVQSGGHITLTGPPPAGTPVIDITANAGVHGSAEQQVQYDPDRRTYDVRLLFPDVAVETDAEEDADRRAKTIDLTMRFAVGDGGSPTDAVEQARVRISTGRPPRLAHDDVVSSGDDISLPAPPANAPLIRVVASAEGFPDAQAEVHYDPTQSVYSVPMVFREAETHSVKFSLVHVNHDLRVIDQLTNVQVEILGKTQTISHDDTITFEAPPDGRTPVPIRVTKQGLEPLRAVAALTRTADGRYQDVKVQFRYPVRAYTLPVRAVAGAGFPVEGVRVSAEASGLQASAAVTDASGNATLRVSGRRLQGLALSAEHDLFRVGEIAGRTLGVETTLAPLTIAVPSTTIKVRTVAPGGYAGRNATINVEVRDVTTGRSTTLASVELTNSGEQEVAFPTPSSEAGVVVITGIPSEVGLSAAEKPYARGSTEPVVLRFEEEDPIRVYVKALDVEEPSGVRVLANGTTLAYDAGEGRYTGLVPAGAAVNITASAKGLVLSGEDGSRLPLRIAVPPDAGEVSGVIRAAWEPVTLRVTARTTAPDGASSPVVGATVHVTNATRAGVSADATTDATGHAAPSIEAGLGDRIEYTVSSQEPAVAGGGSGELTTTAERTYPVEPEFRRLVAVNITVLDAKTGIPTPGATAHVDGLLFASGDLRGVASGYLPRSGPVDIELRAEGYLTESYRAEPGAALTLGSTRYLLRITPPQHSIAVANVTIAEGVPVDSQIHDTGEQFTRAIQGALQDEMRSTAAMDLQDSVVDVNPAHPDWNQQVQAQFVVFPMLLDPTGTDMQLSVMVYAAAEGKPVSSAVSSITPQRFSQAIRTQIGPRLKRNLPLYGYVTDSSPGNLTMNIGTTHEVTVGDQFTIQEVEREPSGRFLSEREGGVGSVTRVAPGSATVAVDSSRSVPAGSMLQRQMSDRRATRLTVTGIPRPAVRRRGVTVSWRVQGEEVSEIGGRGQVTMAPEMTFEFEASTEAIEIIVRHSGGSSSTTVVGGYEPIEPSVGWADDELLTVTVGTAPTGCEVQLIGSRAGRPLPRQRTPVSWTVRAGQYTLMAFAPAGAAGYTDTPTSVLIDPSSGSVDYDRHSPGSGATTVTHDQDGVHVVVQLAKDYEACIKAAGSSYDGILGCVVGIMPEHPQYRKAMVALGRSALPDRPDLAIEAFENMLQVDQRDAAAYYNIGYASSLLSDWDKAADSFLNASKHIHRVGDPQERARMQFDVRHELVLVRHEQGIDTATEAAYIRFKDAYDERMREPLSAEGRSACQRAMEAVKALLQR